MKFYEFDIKVSRKDIKYLRLKITQNGDIMLSLPKYASQKILFDFLQANLENLRKAKKKNLQKQDKLQILGKIYDLKFDENINNIKFKNNQIIAKNKQILQEFLDNTARKILNKKILYFAPLINKPINHISFKHMRTRWGSCNHKKAYINFNLALISKNIKFIEYVVLHELAHLVFNHHQKSFYELIEKFMPDYKQRLKMS